MNTPSVSQAGAQLAAQQSLQRLHATPVIPSQRQIGASGMPNSPFEPSSAVKVGQVMAGSTARGHLLNTVA
jgi:hypothetical protein